MTTTPTIRPSVAVINDCKTWLGSQTVVTALLDSKLDEAYKSADTFEKRVLFFKMLLSIGDTQRSHDIYQTRIGKKLEGGGNGNRIIYRAILRWLGNRFAGKFTPEIMELFLQFSDFKAGVWYFNKTDRAKGVLLGTELPSFTIDEIANWVVWKIRQGTNSRLIAKALPSHKDAKLEKARRRSKIVEKGGKVKGPGVYINGKPAKIGDEYVKGDKLSYKSNKKDHTMKRLEWNKKLIDAICLRLGWTIESYKTFRSTQRTLEQLFSSQKVLLLTREEFHKELDYATGRSRLRAKQTLFDKADKHSTPKPVEKWKHLPGWYNEWLAKENAKVEKVREAKTEVEKQAIRKTIKAKTGNMNLVDLLINTNGDELEVIYEALVGKMELDVPVLVFADISGSMDTRIAYEDKSISMKSISLAMMTFFSMTNPSPQLRGVVSYFAKLPVITGLAEEFSKAPNQYLTGDKYVEKNEGGKKVIDMSKGFSANLQNVKSHAHALYEADTKLKGFNSMFHGTDMGAVVEHFVNLAKAGTCTSESLPKVLMWVTDTETNSGKLTATQWRKLCEEIGWNPLFIFWNLSPKANMDHLKGHNMLHLMGFNPGTLTQLLKNLKGGELIVPEDAVWALADDERYSVLTDEIVKSVITPF